MYLLILDTLFLYISGLNIIIMKFAIANRVMFVLIFILLIADIVNFHRFIFPISYLIEVILLMIVSIYLIICLLNSNKEIAKFGALFSVINILLLIWAMFS